MKLEFMKKALQRQEIIIEQLKSSGNPISKSEAIGHQN